jgi:hypothetical protein
MIENKMERRVPSEQNAVDIFSGRWASKIEEIFPGLSSGPAPMFGRHDRRPIWAAQRLGSTPGSLAGMKVLELGPLEGAHTYQLAELGADSILAIEANSEAYLKCLVVKEILQTPRCKFLLGDCLLYLQAEPQQKFDLIFCSGILYHMENPFELIKAMTARCKKIFLWTHYFDPDIPVVPARIPRKIVCDGLDLTFYEHVYGDPNYARFWGGIKPTASWLLKDDIEKCFNHFNFDVTIIEDMKVHTGGPNISAVAVRRETAL